MVFVYKDPEGETVLPQTPASLLTMQDFLGVHSSQEEKIASLECRITELESLLRAEKVNV